MKAYNVIANKIKEEGSNIFHHNPVLRLSSLPTAKDLQNEKLVDVSTTENQIWIYCECYNFDIQLDTDFDVIFAHSDINNYEKVNSKLKFISIKKSEPVSRTVFPKGMSALCLIEFDLKPKILSKLRYDGELLDKTIHEIFFLTNQIVLDKLLS